MALALHLDGRPPRGANEIAAADVALTVTVPGAAVDEGGDWHAQPQGNPVDAPSVTVEPAADGTRLRAGAVVDTGRLHDGGGDLVVTSFAAPTAVPVALSAGLAEAIDAEIGDRWRATSAPPRFPWRSSRWCPTCRRRRDDRRCSPTSTPCRAASSLAES